MEYAIGIIIYISGFIVSYRKCKKERTIKPNWTIIRLDFFQSLFSWIGLFILWAENKELPNIKPPKWL